MTGPGDERAAAGGGRGRLRASRADRERVIGLLKDAFVQGRLTRQELDTRVGQALASLTCADLAALTADIPAAPAAASLARPPARARRRPLARAAAGSGSCLVIAAAAIWAASILDPGPPGPTPYHSWAKPFLLLAVCAIFMALGILGYGVGSALEQRRSRRPLPHRPRPGGHTRAAPRDPQVTAAPAAYPRPGGPGAPWHQAGARHRMTP